MTFTATGISLSVEQTRATTDNDWEGVAQVAVQVDGEVKLYGVQASELKEGYQYTLHHHRQQDRRLPGRQHHIRLDERGQEWRGSKP